MAIPASGPLALTDIQTEFGGANPIGMNEYYAGGGLVPAGTSGTYGAVPSSGALSIQNFYGTSNFVPIYIEEVFSTFLYLTNDTTQTIVNGINLSANGGLMWFKPRNDASNGHSWVDSARGNNAIYSNSAVGQDALRIGGGGAGSIALNTNGFSFNGSIFDNQGNINNGVGNAMVSWTFRKQPKFFDIVTYTGDGSAPRNISHNLGSVPGCIMIKRTDSTGTWTVYHAGIGNTKALFLNATSSADTNSAYWNDTTPTSSVFTLGGTFGDINANGATYVAYLFAHNAGGFGLTGSDNVISCGTFTTPGSGGVNTVSLGYEPQYLLLKRTDANQGWYEADIMRQMSNTDTNGNNSWKKLAPNTSGAESTENGLYPNSTGFTYYSGATISGAATYIYIAIRRGPMKVPTVGTSVFTPADSGNDSAATDMNFPVDAFWETDWAGSIYNTSTATRLTGNSSMLRTSGNDAANGFFSSLFSNTRQNFYAGGLYGGGTIVSQYGFRRAPKFMDIVCYPGGGAGIFNHNLTVVPEFIIEKSRTDAAAWYSNGSLLGGSQLVLNNTNALANAGWPGGYPVYTSTQFSPILGSLSGFNFVAYLFATCPGVSKVGFYTGTGALQTVNCGFSTGARFILIKRSDSTGNWYLYDSVRGISSGNDPYNLLNSSAANVNGTNYVDTTGVGFQVTAAAPAELNASGGTYFFLAIA